jgi:hypothetical protein
LSPTFLPFFSFSFFPFFLAPFFLFFSFLPFLPTFLSFLPSFPSPFVLLPSFLPSFLPSRLPSFLPPSLYLPLPPCVNSVPYLVKRGRVKTVVTALAVVAADDVQSSWTQGQYMMTVRLVTRLTTRLRPRGRCRRSETSIGSKLYVDLGYLWNKTKTGHACM